MTRRQPHADVPRILVITANANASNSYTLDWLDAFMGTSQLHPSHIDLLAPGARFQLKRHLTRTDAIVLLHSATADDLGPLSGAAKMLAERSVPLCVLVGNEINLPWAPMSEKRRLFHEMRVEVIGSQLLYDAASFLYASVGGARILSVPHAVDPSVLRPALRPSRETRTLGTRTVQYLPILGDSERGNFLDAVSITAESLGWDVDIGTARLGRIDWRNYLSALDVAVGTEAGSWFTMPEDDIVVSILEDARRSSSGPNIALDSWITKAARRLPWGWRQRLRKGVVSRFFSNDLQLLAQLDSDRVFEDYFRDAPIPPVYMKAASSRHLEAAALGTPQLLLEGRYNDIFRPGQHYFSVRADFSDVREQLEAASDPVTRREVADAARQVVLDGNTLEHRIGLILDALFTGQEVGALGKR